MLKKCCLAPGEARIAVCEGNLKLRDEMTQAIWMCRLDGTCDNVNRKYFPGIY